MEEPLKLPEDLAILIEKREGEDRRQGERRVKNEAAPAFKERRSGEDRRSESRRHEDDA